MNDAPHYDLFWDAFNATEQSSGITHYLKNNMEALQSLGVTPKLCNHIEPDVIRRIKTLYCYRLSEAIPKERQSVIIFRGLSNINLPLYFLSQRPQNVRFVITIHDLIPMLYPQYVSKFQRFNWQVLFPNVLKLADRIICISEWTKNSLLEQYSSIENKIVVIPNGFPKSGQSLEMKKSSSRTCRVLTVSRYEPYKNLNVIVDVLRCDVNHDFNMSVVTNQVGIKFFKKNAKKYIDSGRLILHCHLSRTELNNLYSNADVYLQPSLVEGFCLPAAEAQSLGVPVVYLSGSGIDEVVCPQFGVGLKGQFDTEAWCTALCEANLMNGNRTRLDALKSFLTHKNSWNDSAKALKLLYDDLAKSP